MKYIITLFLIALFAAGLTSCGTRPNPIGKPHRAYSTPEYRTRNHFGLRKKDMDKDHRYWGSRRYGPRPHKYRGLYHD